MSDEGFGEDPDRPRPRPKVVDKRVSSRAEESAPAPAAPPPPPPSAPEQSKPGGEQPQPASGAEPSLAPDQATHGPTPAAPSAGAASQDDVWTPEQEARARQIAQEIAETPSYEWVVNTAVTLANVAGTKLDLGAVADAQLAIDALGGLVETVGPRLQQAEAPLRQTLAQLRLAYAERLAPPPA